MQTIARSMADTGPIEGRYMPHAPPIVGRYGKRPHSRMQRLQVECIGKGKAHRPYEFGVKVSIATTVKHSAGRAICHPCCSKLPGNPYDGHTLGTVIPQMQALIGNILDRCITDTGYRGHNASPDNKVIS